MSNENARWDKVLYKQDVETFLQFIADAAVEIADEIKDLPDNPLLHALILPADSRMTKGVELNGRIRKAITGYPAGVVATVFYMLGLNIAKRDPNDLNRTIIYEDTVEDYLK